MYINNSPVDLRKDKGKRGAKTHLLLLHIDHNVLDYGITMQRSCHLK